MAVTMEGACHACRKQVEVSPPVPRKEACPHCGVDLRVCLNCYYHDERAYNECRESAAEPVREKDRANYCEFFRLRAGSGAAAASREDLRAAAEALFKKK